MDIIQRAAPLYTGCLLSYFTACSLCTSIERFCFCALNDFTITIPGRYAYNLCFVFSLGEKGTLTHGSIVDGKFEGFIKSHHGTYYIEPSERYLKEQSLPFHSVIYHEDDIGELILAYH